MSTRTPPIKPPVPDNEVGAKFSRFRSFVGQNPRALKKYLLLFILTQLPLICYALVMANGSAEAAAKAKAETKALLNVFAERGDASLKEFDKRLKALNERFLALRAQYAKTAQTIIATRNSERLARDGQALSFERDSAGSPVSLGFALIDEIGEKVKLGEPYGDLLARLPANLKNDSAYVALGEHAKTPPATYAALTKTFAEIRENGVATLGETNEPVPSWLEKLAKIFKGKIKITRRNETENAAFDTIKAALAERDFSRALVVSESLDLLAVKKWREALKTRIDLETRFRAFSEKAKGAILEEKKDRSR